MKCKSPSCAAENVASHLLIHFQLTYDLLVCVDMALLDHTVASDSCPYTPHLKIKKMAQMYVIPTSSNSRVWDSVKPGRCGIHSGILQFLYVHDLDSLSFHELQPPS